MKFTSIRRFLLSTAFGLSVLFVPLAFASADTSVSIQSLSPGATVLSGQAVTFSVAPVGFTNPTYAISDSFSGTSITSATMDPYGNFTWTPTNTDGGTHNITITVSDSAGDPSANITETINVQAPTSLNITNIQPDTSVAASSTLTFSISETGLINPSYTLVDSFSGTTLTNSNVASSSFTWVPAASDVGTHTITIYATDANGHSANTSIAIVVTSPPTPVVVPTPVVTPIPVVTTPTPVTPSAPAYVFNNYLSPGLTSPDVTALQNILIQDGYLLVPATGYYGDLTTAAVEQFQTAHNLDSIGVVGPATRAALNSLDGASTSSTSAAATTSSSSTVGDGFVFNDFLDVGSTGNDVTELQNKLTALGDYSGPITGYFGSLTQAAVEVFQGANNIEQVGYVGPATRAALNQ